MIVYFAPLRAFSVHTANELYNEEVKMRPAISIKTKKTNENDKLCIAVLTCLVLFGIFAFLGLVFVFDWIFFNPKFTRPNVLTPLSKA